MQRKKKKTIKINDAAALENLLQEVYNDANNQITEVNELIINLDIMATPSDVDDLTKIAKEKTNALKLKDNATRIKLDISKMMKDIIKDNDSESDASKPETATTFESNESFDKIREMLEDELKNGK